MYQVKYSLKNTISQWILKCQFTIVIHSNANVYLIDQLLFTMQNTTLHEDI